MLFQSATNYENMFYFRNDISLLSELGLFFQFNYYKHYAPNGAKSINIKSRRDDMFIELMSIKKILAP